MLDEDILNLREKLNESIRNKRDYKITYKISVELDNLISKYYNTGLKKNNKKEQKLFCTKK